jgi:hypothetical protein
MIHASFSVVEVEKALTAASCPTGADASTAGTAAADDQIFQPFPVH